MCGADKDNGQREHREARGFMSKECRPAVRAYVLKECRAAVRERNDVIGISAAKRR